jgi:hypothetical protein
MYDKKLQKANEEIGKKNAMMRDLETENLKLKEEVTTLKSSQKSLDREA